ncbi:MAG: CpsB/CapC family capsule biosynthesis tyrosine phosphatase [Bacillota bacterium]
MVDVHSHILPNIDDGPSETETSIAIALKAEKAGFTDIICTPHFSPTDHNLEEYLKVRDASFSMLNSEIIKNDLKIRVHKGLEVEFVPELIKLIDGFDEQSSVSKFDVFCLAGSRYILLEMSQLTYPMWADKSLYELQLRGFIPVIAHLERYSWILREKEEVFKWAERGVVFQINAENLDFSSKRLHSKVMDFILRDSFNLVIGSDAHDNKKRDMSAIGKIFSEKYFAKYTKKAHKTTEWIENGFKILENRVII